MNPTIASSGSTLDVQSIRSCVVYDESNGRIHHLHSVLTLAGGREPGDEEIGRDALAAYARQPQANLSQLRVLHVAPDAFEPGTSYRVDPAKRSLVRERRSSS